jgi:hypothetical protein
MWVNWESSWEMTRQRMRMRMSQNASMLEVKEETLQSMTTILTQKSLNAGGDTGVGH